MTTIKNDNICKFFNCIGFAFYPFVVVKNNASDFTINHEKIHIRQQKEMFVIFFYLVYGLNFIYNLFLYKDSYKAYRNIIFEREAYQNEKNLNYLKERKPFAFLKYEF